jgi:tetratricopeptide (TPR) repeat protein
LEVARQAVALDPTSQVAHHALAHAHFHRQELDAFFAEAERSLALNPNHAFYLAATGFFFEYAGDERGIALVKKAMKLDPLLPTIFNFSIAHHHFERGEYEEALATVRKIDFPGFFMTQLYLAAIYAELGRNSEARPALEELLRIYPGFTTEKLIEERRKWNESDEMLRRWAAALRKAGLPE